MAVDTTVDRWKINQYLSNVFMLASQEESRLSPYVNVVGGLKGEKVFLDDIFDPDSVMDVRERTSRAQPSPAGSGSYERRCVHNRTFDWWSQAQDSIDKYTNIHEMDSIHRRAASRKIGQRRDQLILGTLISSGTVSVNTETSGGFFGNAYEGKEGTTAVSLPTTAYTGSNASAAYVVPVDLEGSNTSITYEKLLAVKEIFMTREVLMPGDTIVVPLNARLKKDLKRDLELINKDYVSSDQVTWSGGEIMGVSPFVFPHYEGLLLNGSSHYRLPVWIPRYMTLAIWGGVEGDIVKRPDLSNSYQLMFMYSENAVRAHEEGVAEIVAA